MSEWIPRNDHIVVKRDPAYVSPVGIVVPQQVKIVQSKEQLGHTGVVVAVGPGRRKRAGVVPLDVKVGDRISFGQIQYTECDGYLVMKEDAVAFVYGKDRHYNIGDDSFTDLAA